MIYVESLRPFEFSTYEIKMFDSLAIWNNQWYLFIENLQMENSSDKYLMLSNQDKINVHRN